MDYHGFNFSTIPSADRAGVLNPMLREATRQVRARVDNARRTPFMINDASLSELQACFEHSMVFSDQNIYSPHPIYASLLHFDTVDFYDIASTHRNRQGRIKPFIDIGGAISKTVQAHRHGLPVHCCYLVNNPRDSHRVISNAFRLSEEDALRNDIINHAIAQTTYDHPNFCGGCTEKCTFKCDLAIGIHSLYDMTPAMVYETFDRHQLKMAYFSILVPYELNFPYSAEARRYANRHPYTFRRDGDRAIFHFSDGDFPYEHDYHSWQFWSRCSMITGDNFSISIGIIARHGICWRLQFTRIARCESPHRRVIPCDFLNAYVAVPNLFHYAFNEQRPQDQLPHLTVPREYYNRVTNFIIKPEAVSIPNVYQFALSIISRIDIASVTVNHAWMADARAVNEATYSIVFLALAVRRLDRNLCAEAFSIIDDQEGNTEHRTCTERISLRLRDLYRRIRAFVGLDASEKYCDPQADSFRVKNMLPQTHADLEFNLIHILRSAAPIAFMETECSSLASMVQDVRDHAPADNLPIVVDRTASHPPTIASHCGSIDNVSLNSLPLNVDALTVALKRISATDGISVNSCSISSVGSRTSRAPSPVQKSLPPTTTTTIQPTVVAIKPLPPPMPAYRLPATVDLQGEVDQTPPDIPKTAPVQFKAPHIPAPTINRHIRMFTVKPGGDTFPIAKRALPDIPQDMYDAAIAHLQAYRCKDRAAKKLEQVLEISGCDLIYPVLDVGAGPGIFSTIYTGHVDAIEHPNTPIIKHLRDKYNTITQIDVTDPYTFRTGGHPTIIIDACAGIKDHTKMALAHATQVCRTLADLVIHKLFTENDNMDIIRLYAQNFGRLLPVKPPSSKDFSSEYYLIVCERRQTGDPSLHTIMKEEWLIHEKVHQARLEAISYTPLDVYHPDAKVTAVDITLSINRDELEAALAYYATLDNRRYRAILESINPDKVKLHLPVKAITGIAGCGKSVLAASLRSGTSLVITPTNDLATEFTNSTHFKNWEVVTPHTALQKYADTVLIDECFTQAVAYPHIVAYLCRAKNIILAGSCSQIGALDPHKHLCGSRHVGDVVGDFNLASQRCPQDAIRLVSSLQPGCSSTSSISRSIVVIKERNSDICARFIREIGYRTFAYNQETKRFCRKHTARSDTIHGLQGATVTRAVLYIDNAAFASDIRHQIQHVMVGLTRHTDTLILLGRTDEITRVLYYNNSAFERNDLALGRHLGDFSGLVPIDNRPRIEAISEKVCYPKATIDAVVDTLNGIIKTDTQDDDEAAVLQTDCPPPTDAKLKVKVSAFLAQYRKDMKGKYIGHYRFARRYTPSTYGTIKCFMSRYANKTRNGDRIHDTITMIEGLASWAREFNPAGLNHEHGDFDFADQVILGLSPQARGFIAQIQRELHRTVGGKTADNLVTYFTAEYAKNLQAKGCDRTDAERDLEAEQFRRCVDFFVKKQVKPDVRDAFDERDKAHQGISAWKKYQNFMFAAYTRMFTAIFQNLLKPNVIFASNESDAIINARASALIADAEDKGLPLRNFAADFEQFDSSVTNAGPGMNAVFMYIMGCPAWLCQEYLAQRGNWRLCERWCALLGRDKMHSGEPWTLMGNTIYNMAVLGAAFSFVDYIIAIFKGDDSGVIGGTVTSRCEDYLASHGMSIKIETSCALEFAGFFLNRYGGFPDVLRRAVKFVSTVYRDKTHYDESIINLRAELAIIRDNTAFLYGAEQCASYYNEVRRTSPVTASQIRLIAGAMYHESFNEYAKLLPFDKTILTFRKDQLLQ